MSQTITSDYSLTGVNAARAVEKGLAEAEWYTTPVPKAEMRKLLERRNGPAIRDTALLLVLLLATGYATVALWGTWWVVIPYLIYAVLYGTSSDSRWHECGHGTAFKTDWMNSALYEIASFMVMRESVVWRWSHNRHHSDTIIVGRDPEIQIPRPPDLRGSDLEHFQRGRIPHLFPESFPPRTGPHGGGRTHVHSGERVPQGLSQRPDLRGDLRAGDRLGHFLAELDSHLPVCACRNFSAHG